MKFGPRTLGRLAAGLAATTMLVTAACGGATVNGAAEPAASGSGSGAACGTVNMAMNDWVGYTADAAVVTYVAEQKLGCKVDQKALKEEIAWQGFGSGQVDVIMENWGHADLTEKYITQQKVAVDGGQTGNKGQIGWYVPPWLAKEHPDILDWNNLNKYAAEFKTSESGDKGQLLDGDPSFVTNDEALVKNLNLNYKVVYAGSEAALIQSFRDAETNKKWVLGYFYSPQWFLSEVPLEKVSLPAYTDGCDTDAAKVACDYPDYTLNKILSTKFADSGSPAAKLIKNFTWTNDDQNVVAKYITADKMSPEDAAKKWVDANPDKVEAWLK
ncbi:ABC transporter substrate-binding protein [uncultured Friedmanniella sp.]|uniref:ABC transporter substrate-binding protein n=1 Tax=uncultured Friedmanniella sp. TaxID=335381 RepID=UPI0035CA8B44